MTCYSQIQQGEASYYKDVFEGRKTANGEIFQQNLLTAAHRSLAFGSIVKLTNRANGKSVEVRINDRGPYIRNRIVDVTKSVAVELDFIDTGVAEVELEVISFGNSHPTPSNLPLEDEEDQIAHNAKSPVNKIEDNISLEQKLLSQINNASATELYFNVRAEPVKPDFYAVQIASFADASNALNLGLELEKAYQEEVTLRYKLLNGKALYTLALGQLATRLETEKLLVNIKTNYQGAFIVNLTK
ncbi:RlpA-like protein [Psychroflexus salis]|uniref:Probable endolytic peptidoglycan transglycosylase RlpA n=1 Tax=Psychroflexus salis TaxID=1526574 RepID=A0A916ZXY0_9FLAO|nr:RlpA-like protein [Psychroflexus salis]